MSCNCNCGENNSLVNNLRRNVGRVIIVNTRAGGPGLTGLLASVDDENCKLITTLPSAPTNPYDVGGSGCCGRRNNEFGNLCNGRRNPSHFGSAVIIPLCQVTSCVFAEV